MGVERGNFESINGTLLRRILTLVSVKLCKRWRPWHGGVLMLSNKLCVKYGYFQDVSEAATIQFIAQNTSIPVPKIYCAFRHKNVTYIVMERIRGHYIGRGWVHRTKESQAKILQQLKDMVDEMRRIPPSHDAAVANVHQGPLYDERLPASQDRNRLGPFKTVGEFHTHLRHGISEVPNDKCPEINELIRMHQGEWPICFTHADLSSLNVLAHGDKVVGIIDWEAAGWYPSYWEYTSAWNVNPQNMFWRDEVEKFLDAKPKELAMERLREKYFGQFGD